MKFIFLIFFLTELSFASWTLTTFNIRNFDKDLRHGKTNIQELSKLLKSMNSDVFAFQEIVNKSAFDKLVNNLFPGYEYKISTCGGGGSQRLALVYNPKIFQFISENEDLTFSDSSGQDCGSLRPLYSVTLKFLKDKKNYHFHLVHLKAGSSSDAMAQRWRQYKMLEKMMGQTQNEDIFLGDFNSTGYILHDKDFDRFQSMLAVRGFRSSAEESQCTNYWEGPKNSKDFQPSILDHIVMRDSLFKTIQSVNVGAHCQKTSCLPVKSSELGVTYAEVSDHCPVQVTFH